jgi:DNA-binding response OmpR family regulator
MRILVVEDERKVGQFVVQALKEQSYATSLVGTVAAAHDALAESSYDATILDLGLPDGDGLELLKEWRQNGFTEPVLILSARDSVTDRVGGLNLGADDYLPKPFSVEELLARLRSLMRRGSGMAQVTMLERNGLKLDLLARELKVKGEPMELTNREFALLELFMLNPGRALTRTLIAEKVWEASYDMETNLIDVYVRRLRQKLEGVDGENYFKTMRGTGYKLL